MSGSADPDVFIVNRSLKNNNLKIVQKKIGEKSNFVFVAKDGQVETSDVEMQQRNQFCLTDADLLKLCEIGIFLEQNYRSPRDIEWAVFDNNIYLLQSRPMTSTHAFSSWELLHEFDTPVMSNEDLMTFGNTGEVLPNPLTPLSLIVDFNEGLVEVIAHRKAMRFCPEMYAFTHYRAALTIYNSFLAFVPKEITFDNRVHALCVFGHEFVDEKVHKIAIHRNGYGSKWRKLYMMYDAFKCVRNMYNDLEELKNLLQNLNGKYDEENIKKKLTVNELYDDISETLTHMKFATTKHSIVTKSNTIYDLIVFSSLAEGSKTLTADHIKDITTIMSSCKNAESAEIPTMLNEIACSIQKEKNCNEFLSIDSKFGVEWLKENNFEAYGLLQEFIKRHAHRGYCEVSLVCSHSELILILISMSSSI